MNPTEDAFAEELIGYWLSFVRSGDPNTYKLARSPNWAPFSSHNKERIVLQQGPENSTNVSGSSMEEDFKLEAERCQFVVTKVDEEQN